MPWPVTRPISALDGAHQRVGEQQRPAQAIAELGADLGIGGDAAGIIVRRAGDQAGAHDIAQAGAEGQLDRLGLGDGVSGLLAHGRAPFGACVMEGGSGMVNLGWGVLWLRVEWRRGAA
jgi:hypothetical protein